MSYTLKDDGYPWKVIYHRGKAVGRVFAHAKGGYVGFIKPHTSARYNTVEEAFAQVVATSLGFADARALHDHLATYRRRKSAARRQGRALAQAFLHGSQAEREVAFNVILEKLS